MVSETGKRDHLSIKFKIVVHNGTSLTNFNRPAFQKMIGLVKKNEIRTIPRTFHRKSVLPLKSDKRKVITSAQKHRMDM